MPEPSHLVLLAHLTTTPPGTKVRFLGCVHAYDLSTATLYLRTRYPTTTREHPTAAVSVQNVLETLDRSLLEVGAWVNVMGYVRRKGEKGSHGRESSAITTVDASMVWTAGAIKLEEYEEATKVYLADIASLEGLEGV